MKKRRLEIKRDRVKRLQAPAGGVTGTSTISDTFPPPSLPDDTASDPKPSHGRVPTLATFTQTVQDTLKSVITAGNGGHQGDGGGKHPRPTLALTAVVCRG